MIDKELLAFAKSDLSFWDRLTFTDKDEILTLLRIVDDAGYEEGLEAPPPEPTPQPED